MRKRLFLLLCLLLVSLPLLAETAPITWQNQGNSWKSSTGISAEIPAAFVAEPQQDGSLHISDPSGDIFIALDSFPDKTTVDKFMQGLDRELAASNPQWGPLKTDKTPSGERVTKSGTGSLEGKPVDMTMGWLSNGKTYCIFFAFYNSAKKAAYDPDISKLIESVSFKS